MRIAKAVKAGNVQLGEIPTGMRNLVNHALDQLNETVPVESKPVAKAAAKAPTPKKKDTKNASKEG